MHPFDDDYLSKMLPGFEKKPRSETAAPPRQAPGANSESSEKASSPQPSTPELFDSIAAYIRRYLVCNQQQLTVLTLWAAYTRCFKAFRTAVYLNVSSPEPQSGKSLCLMLLNELALRPSFITGASPATLMKSLLTESNQADGNKFENTLFLDDFHHTFGASERQPVVAMLNSGSDAAPCFYSGPHEYYLFGPKAFAGNASLPRSLSARCIPISLRRRKVTDTFIRFFPRPAHERSLKLVEQLVPWIENHRAAIEEAALTIPKQIPPGLAPREQACSEPLIHIADLVGGSWPTKVREAVSAIFRLNEGSEGIQLLGDIRAVFSSKENPEHISTKDLLSGLREFDHRPWSGWGSSSGKKLGHLLKPFGIHGRKFEPAPKKELRGYRFENFHDAWDRYLPPAIEDSVGKSSIPSDSVGSFSL